MKYSIIFLTSKQQEIDHDNQVHLNGTGTEFVDNFSIGKEKEEQIFIGTLIGTYATDSYNN